MFKEFKQFALRGNVVDLAIGVIIGAAFGKIISSLVQDIIMPPLGLLLGKVDFTNLFVTLSGPPVDSMEMAKTVGAVTLNYGNFINTVVDFVIVAFVIFLVVRQMNKLHKATPIPVTTKPCPRCKMNIDKEATRCPYCTSELTA